MSAFQADRRLVIRRTPPSCLTNPAPRLLTVENRFAPSAKIDRVIDRRPFNFVSSVRLRPNRRGLNNGIDENWSAKPSLESKPRENKVVSCSFTRDFIVLREDKIVYLLSGFWVLNLTFLFLSFTKNCEISSRPVVVVVIVSEIQSIRDYVSNYLTFFSRYIRVTSLTLQLRFLTQEFHLLLFQVGNSKIKSAGRLLVEAVCSERRSIRYYNWINTRDIVTRVDNNFEGIKERELSSI